MTNTDWIDEILGTFAGFASVAWDKDGVFMAEELLEKQENTKQVILTKIDELTREARQKLLEDLSEYASGDISDDVLVSIGEITAFVATKSIKG